MKILFTGGNGNISWHCVQEAIDHGHEVYELNRGMTRNTRREIQREVHQLIGDVRDRKAMECLLGGRQFDVVCDFICFNGKQAAQAIELFYGKVDQYIVISSEAVYKRGGGRLPFTEDSEKYSLEESQGYIKGKIEVEQIFQRAYKESGFPVTIVRPGYTYDTIIPTPAGGNCFTAVQKMLEGNPMIMLGDGNNICAPMHSGDFAKQFLPLCGNMESIGESYHITGQQLLTWNEMEQAVMRAFKVEDQRILHIPEEEVMTNPVFQYDELVKQHMLHYIFDNSKIERISGKLMHPIEFEEGMRKTAEWMDENPCHKRIDKKIEMKLTAIYKEYGRS